MKLLKSRGNWALVAIFLIGGVEAIAGYIPDSVETVVLGALGLAVVYFKMSPSQEY
jgi:hypothetical protein